MTAIVKDELDHLIDKEWEYLESLGAKRVEQVSSWWIMEAPTGHRFCVVKAEGPAFVERANSWE